jgi:hypothetical protein
MEYLFYRIHRREEPHERGIPYAKNSFSLAFTDILRLLITYCQAKFLSHGGVPCLRPGRAQVRMQG